MGLVAGHPGRLQKAEAAEKFISWATSKDYTELVAAKEGWANVPPGTRTSLYANAEYQKAAPFAKMTLDSINSADPTKPTVKPVPYVGVQFVAIPEFQGLGTTVGQLFSAALAGQMSVDDALEQAQDAATRDNDRRRLHQVSAPTPRRPRPVACLEPRPRDCPVRAAAPRPHVKTSDTSADLIGGTRHGYSTDPHACALHAGAVGHRCCWSG